MTTGALDPRKVDEVADKAIGYLSGAGVSALIYLGDRLGLYHALSEAGPSTSAELAAKAGLHERWVREWLHGQASAGLVHYAGDGRYKLTPEQAAVLADEDNPAFVGGGFALIFPLLQRWERLFDSFRTGRGVPYNDLGKVERLAKELAAVQLELEQLRPVKPLTPEEWWAARRAQVRAENERLLPLMDALFERWGIPKDMEPIPAEQLQQMMVECGIKPKDNVFSRAIIEMREE
jgi:hypothetical protein